jgi:Asp-tRNA(Asn)/Glu-tRNA(Gln) amidotransferase A subunit family amidase
MSMNQTPQRRPYFSRTASFADGTDSPLRVLQECLAEIDRREPAVGAFTVIDAASATGAAHASAARWRAGRPLSAIDGMPVGVKDMIDSADMVTGMGSPLFDSYRPARRGDLMSPCDAFRPVYHHNCVRHLVG